MFKCSHYVAVCMSNGVTKIFSDHRNSKIEYFGRNFYDCGLVSLCYQGVLTTFWEEGETMEQRELLALWKGRSGKGMQVHLGIPKLDILVTLLATHVLQAK